MQFSCNYCGKCFNKGTSLGGHVPRCKYNPSFIPKIKIKKEYKCKWCNKEYDSGLKLGGHVVHCSLNPSSSLLHNTLSNKAKGRKSSKNTRDLISKTINEKIKNGTWHLSFSHSRIYKYNGINLHGKWELEYAKYLDESNIKWRRPTEKFEYYFENKKRYYTPDFYLINENIYIEIKGYETDKDRAKWKSFPLNLKIIKGKDLYKIGLIKSYKEI